MFVMIDANFCLKLKARGFIDEALSEGWAYFVNPEKYKKHITAHVHIKHMNTTVHIKQKKHIKSTYDGSLCLFNYTFFSWSYS